ncbi:MAG TPA: glycosyltransferase family 4 protein [Terriglobales bacterium]|jgi:glycosyltransferase involved in cell wall biosynthesis
MKILYISQYFPPEIGAPAARASELARHWTQEGHEVTVLTGFPNHPNGIVPPEYKSVLRRLLAKEKFAGGSVVRSWLLPFPNRKPYERILNYSSFFMSAAITGVFLARPEVVVATSPQILVALAGWWIARCKRVPFVFEVRDLWPESLTAVGMGKEGSLLYRTLAKIAGFLYRHSDHIVVVTPAFKDHLVRNWNVPAEKISIVQNGVETELFSPRNADPLLRSQLGAEGKFLVSYIGTIGMAHGLDTLIEAAAKLQIQAPHVEFLLVGEGADRERICALANSRGLTNLHFAGLQPRERIPAYIAVSDACLVLLKKADVFETVIPTKMLEFMSGGRPVVLGLEGQARKIVENAAAGIWIRPESAEELVKAIIHLENNRGLAKQLGANGRNYVLQHLSRKQTAVEYLALLEELIGTGAPLRAAVA